MPLSPIQLETLILDAISGNLNKQQQEILSHELSQSQEARELYCIHSKLHSALKQKAKGLQLLSTPPAESSMAQIFTAQKRRERRVIWSSIAAVIMITLITLSVVFVKPAPPLEFVAAPGTEFTITHSDPESSTELLTLEENSRLQISQGSVELSLASGVKSIIMAPADLTLLTPDRLHLKEGTAWFRVPAGAEGFTVQTDELQVVDLGTEFGILANSDKRDEVHVITGKVEVSSRLLESQGQLLTSGEARSLTSAGQLRSIPATPAAFLTNLPSALPHLHLSFDGSLDVDGNLPLIDQVVTTVKGSTFETTSSNGQFGGGLKLPADTHIETNWEGITGNAPRSIAYWIKLPSHKSLMHPIVGWGAQKAEGASECRAFYSYVQTDPDETKSVACLSFGAYWVAGDTPIADNQWHHVAFIYNGEPNSYGDPKLTCYVDGKPEKLEEFRGENVDNNENILVNTASTEKGGSPLWIYGHNWPIGVHKESHTRELDELYIFQGALSRSEVLELYQSNSHAHQNLSTSH